MNISDLSTNPIISIDSLASPYAVAELMRAQHVGSVVVTVPDGEVTRVIGVLTDRDLALAALSHERDPRGLTAGQIASTQIVSVPADADLLDAVTVMQKHGVRRLLVTGSQGELAGIVTADDLLDLMAVHMVGLSSALREGISREGERRADLAGVPRGPLFLPFSTPGMRAMAAASSYGAGQAG